MYTHPISYPSPFRTSPVNPSTGTTISTLPVVTKCHIKPDDTIHMIVVIRDRDQLIQTDFAAGNDVLQVIHRKDGTDKNCAVTQADNSLTYFKVSSLGLGTSYNWDVGTGPRAGPLTRSLAPLTRFARPIARFISSSWVSGISMTDFQGALNRSV